MYGRTLCYDPMIGIMLNRGRVFLRCWYLREFLQNVCIHVITIIRFNRINTRINNHAIQFLIPIIVSSYQLTYHHVCCISTNKLNLYRKTASIIAPAVLAKMKVQIKYVRLKFTLTVMVHGPNVSITVLLAAYNFKLPTDYLLLLLL